MNNEHDNNGSRTTILLYLQFANIQILTWLKDHYSTDQYRPFRCSPVECAAPYSPLATNQLSIPHHRWRLALDFIHLLPAQHHSPSHAPHQCHADSFLRWPSPCPECSTAPSAASSLHRPPWPLASGWKLPGSFAGTFQFLQSFTGTFDSTRPQL